MTASTQHETLEIASGPGATLDLADSLRAALRDVSEGITVQAGDGRLRYANDAALRFLGLGSLAELEAWQAGELERRFELSDASGAPMTFDDLPGRRILAGRPADDVLVRIRARAEEDRWAVVRASPVRDPGGRVQSIITLFRNVTDEVVAAERLRFQAGLLDELDSAIVVTGTDGLVHQWSKGAERLFGIQASEALNQPPERLFAAAAHVWPRRLLDALASPRRWSGEVAWRRADRRVLELFVTAAPLRDADSRPTGTLAVIVDERERRRAERRLESSERRLRELADLVPQLVWTVQARGRMGLLNRRWREYVGEEAPPGRAAAWESVVHPEEVAAVRRQWRRARRRSARFTGEVRLRRADGVYRWHLVNIEPIPGVGGRATSWIGTAMDVDERRRAEEWLRLLAEASRVLDGSLGPNAATAGVAALTIGSVADWLAVDLVAATGAFRRLFMRGKDPVASEVPILWSALGNVVAVSGGDSAGAPGDSGSAARGDSARAACGDSIRPVSAAAEAIRTSQSVLHPSTPPEVLLQLALDRRTARRLERLGTRSAMVVPLLVRGRAIGALTFGSAELDRSYGTADLSHAQNLARRLGEAIDRARLNAEVSDVKTSLDATLDSVVMFDPFSLRITYANRGACDQLGYSRDQLVGMSKLVVMPEFDEASLRALVAALIRERTPQQLLTLHRRHDGTHLPVELSVQYVVPAGGSGRIVAVARDISERVQAQARLQRLVQAERSRAAEFQTVVRAIGDAVFVCARDGTITFANDAAEALFGEAPAASYEAVAERLDGAPALEGAAAMNGPVQLSVRGAERWLEMSVFPVGEDQRPEALEPRAEGVAWIVLLRDITAARRAERAREAMFSVLSHELRTPITTIYGASSLLARASGRITERQRSGLVSDIQAEADRLHRLVEDLLVLARSGEGGLETVGADPLLLQRALPGVMRAVRRQWPGIRVVRRIPRDLPTVRGDGTYLEQVMRNLLSNAMKYSPAGSPISIVADSRGDEVRVRVLDRGPGIDPAESERLFEPFFRSPRLSSRASGAGIGLFVCRRLVEAMGGRVWAARRSGGGAEFGFALRIFAEVDV